MMTTERRYLFLILIIFIAACIETDIYLPAFPDMMEFFQTSEEAIQSLLTWNFLGICISGPVYGPLSDVYGRKKPLLVALTIFFIGSLMTLVSHSFSLMLWGRLLQGLGSGGCFTLGTAIIFDVFQNKKAIQAINKLNAIVPFIMAAAPMLGGYLNYAYGFRSNFLAIAVFVALSLVTCSFCFQETLKEQARMKLNLKNLLKDFARVFKCLAFWQMTLIVGLLFAGYMAFISITAVLFVAEMNVSKTLLPFFQVGILGAWLVASLISGRYMEKWGSSYFKKSGLFLIVLGLFALLTVSIFVPKNPYLLTASMMLYTVGVNWTQGIYFPEGMELLPDIKGITASLLTSARLLMSAFVVALMGAAYDGTIYPIVMVMSLIVLIVMACVYSYEKSFGQNLVGGRG